RVFNYYSCIYSIVLLYSYLFSTTLYRLFSFFFFFFNDTAPTEIYTLSLHDALPICLSPTTIRKPRLPAGRSRELRKDTSGAEARSEEHTSELQSPCNLVCRLLLEKKKKKKKKAKQKQKKKKKKKKKKK